MTVDIALVLSILAVSVLFLITEWIPMEVVALLTLGSLAVTGLLPPQEALSGFSNPAVVTVWAVFILSGALTRTGVANVLVMGPGGYRFLDYVKIGLPLTIILFLVLLFVVPLFWPLHP